MDFHIRPMPTGDYDGTGKRFRIFFTGTCGPDATAYQQYRLLEQLEAATRASGLRFGGDPVLGLRIDSTVVDVVLRDLNDTDPIPALTTAINSLKGEIDSLILAPVRR